MNQILDSMGLTPISLTYEAYRFCFVNIRDDKLVFVLEISDLQELRDFVLLLPDIREKISVLVQNQNPNGFTRVPLAAYLWDLYVVGVYRIGDHPLDETDVSTIERDRFVARKIVIQYGNQEQLHEQLEQQLLPENELSNILRRQESNFGELNNMVSQIAEQVKIPNTDTQGNVSIQEVMVYLDEILRVKDGLNGTDPT